MPLPDQDGWASSMLKVMIKPADPTQRGATITTTNFAAFHEHNKTSIIVRGLT